MDPRGWSPYSRAVESLFEEERFSNVSKLALVTFVQFSLGIVVFLRVSDPLAQSRNVYVGFNLRKSHIRRNSKLSPLKEISYLFLLNCAGKLQTIRQSFDESGAAATGGPSIHQLDDFSVLSKRSSRRLSLLTLFSIALLIRARRQVYNIDTSVAACIIADVLSCIFRYYLREERER